MWDDFVEDDFLAPPTHPSGEEAETIDDDWTPEQGFPDSLHAVRVWADADGIL